MASLEEIAADVVASVDASDIGYPIVAKWVRLRYQQLATRTKLKHLRQLGQVVIPAVVNTGTVTATRDSNSLALNAAATAVCSPAIVGRFIRLSVVWYEIIGYVVVGGLGFITIKDVFAENSVTAGTYTIVSRFTPIDPQAAWIGRSFVHARRRVPLTLATMEDLNQLAPYRPLVNNSGPNWVAEGPETDKGAKTIECYPYSTLSEAIFFVYWKDVPDIAMTEPLSNRMKPYALKEGALIDCYRFLMAQAAKSLRVEQAAFYRNEMRAQETKWEQYLRELIQSDQGEDDGHLILRLMNRSNMAGEIRTAREQVLASWP